MKDINAFPGPILKDGVGAPIWPSSDFVGSLSHSGTLCAAAVGTKGNISALGIDIERCRQIPIFARSRICNESELISLQAELRGQLALPASALALIFSMKEACYKVVTGLMDISNGLRHIILRDFHFRQVDDVLYGSFTGDVLLKAHCRDSLFGLIEQDCTATRAIAWH